MQLTSPLSQMNQSTAQREADEHEALRQEIKGRLGKIIGERWRLVRYIGVGASAAVYQGEDVQRAEPVAVKILHSRFVNSRIVRQRFVREQQIMDQIRHTNVLRIDCTGVTDADEPFMVMELLEGATLEKIMKRSPQGLPPLEVASHMEHVLEALAFCHSKGVIHRDLKPANIFLTKKNVIKLLDFGVARFHMDGLQQLTRDGTALGTPAFMSPEQATGRLDKLDARSDIFSVGATMHYMLSGQFLHQGRTADETFVMAATTPAPSLARRAPNLPLALVRLVDRAVAWAPDDRWPDAFEMLSALRQLILDGVLGDGAAPPHADSAAAVPVLPVSSPALPTPAVERHREALEAWWRALPPVLDLIRQHGLQHKQVMLRVEERGEALLRIIRELPHQQLDLQVMPHSLLFEGKACWAPDAPWHGVCRRLAISGAQTVRMTSALTPRALAAFLALCMVEPGPSTPIEEDLLTALWERPLAGISVPRQRLGPIEPFLDAQRFERELTSRMAELDQSLRQEWAWQHAHAKRLPERLAAPPPPVWLDDPAKRVREDGTSALISEENFEWLLDAYRRQPERASLHLAKMLADLWTDAVIEGDEARIARVWTGAMEGLLRERGPLEVMALLAGTLARTTRPEARIALTSQIIERALLPHLADHLQAPSFHTSPVEHRKSFLTLMRQLAPQTTDQVAVELVRSTAQHAAPPGWETTRAVAAEYLGQFGPHDVAMRALEAASRAAPWNGPEVREAAGRALAQRARAVNQ
jgi:tRNA A-37 threonylcarbamoyl transferase component Bud32